MAPLVFGIAFVSGKGEVAVFCEDEAPFLIESENVDSQNIKFVTKQTSRIHFGSIGQGDLAPIAGIYLSFADPASLRLPYRIRLKRFGFKDELFALVKNDPIPFFLPIVIVVL